MPRVNIAAEADLIEQLESEAKKRGYTIYSLTNAALKALLKLLKEGEDANTLESLVDYYTISKALDIVPVTSWFLENLTKLAYEKDSKQYENMCEEVGEQIGSFLRSKASTLDELFDFYNAIKIILPIRNVAIKNAGDVIEFRITGTGFSLISTLCAGKIFSKIAEAYDLSIQDVDVVPGGIVTIKAKANLK
ncbi:conserved hypothetical protein [Sulfolobus islandicus Y.G.57.14]|jgi:hypothetical protein|uniref:Uncharacterized protein n=10 Tax=Saccharolobus islandicus TaxID=43080 RepID=M9U3E2_SACIS|nr:hypothetical protein [Sulfolobus islandicus]ACP34198.1 conserved hypothetical protein [Sulfolobus islandicus L.S.2.15]ACP36936.1 conserved hypothetical protein [Sulfolobus islandicus M.14.25]ACP44338.1 conserved hypothetical protein [Sulfolobus islandicus Y.G.57.14]ACP47243.1 conserved hypothetical protein [Sulfolobus islandicus Y.N.15.51]ACP54073.1 conserved hypothetical protein [Sulfolobus islandicus M.16.27]